MAGEGDFVNKPDDPGDATEYDITREMLARWHGPAGERGGDGRLEAGRGAGGLAALSAQYPRFSKFPGGWLLGADNSDPRGFVPEEHA